MSGRTVLIIVLLVLLAGIIGYVLLQGAGGLGGWLSGGDAQLPVDLARVIPDTWRVEPAAGRQCNFDDDEDVEWLVTFRYDQTSLPTASKQVRGTIEIGPWGATIFDLRPDALPEQPNNPGPYRPAEVYPYKLLPDFYAGKGQGYIGESKIEVFFAPAARLGPECKTDEINLLGYGNEGLATRLSIAWWGGKAVGYHTEHFAGNARIVAEPRADAGKPITRVTTYNRIDNHRSLLCEAETFERLALGFAASDDARTIDFCYAAPQDPYYPEAVVVALLRGQEPAGNEATLPPLASFLLDNVTLPPELKTLRNAERDPIAIRLLGNPGILDPAPPDGYWCTADQIKRGAAQMWWCGRERASIVAEVRVGDQWRQAQFVVTSVMPAKIFSDVHWRIEQVELTP